MRPMKLLGLVAISLIVVGGVWAATRHRGAHHFTGVVDGVLYRSGQPAGDDWARLQRDYHFRTVVNLRDDGPTDQPEDALVARHGMRYVHIPMSNHRRPTTQQAEQFLQVMRDPASAPVLVHCARGYNRTGVLIAVYRMRVQGWSLERATAEAENIRGSRLADEFSDFLRQFASEPPSSQPADPAVAVTRASGP